MRLTYRTQRRLRFAGLIAALLALLFIIAWFCSVVFLERYVVFTRDGAKLDTSFSANDVIGEVARPPVGDTGITIYYNEGADSVTFGNELTRLDGYFIDIDDLQKNLGEVWDLLESIKPSTPILIDMKGGNGHFYYSSTLPYSEVAKSVSVASVDEMIRDLNTRGFYTIARISAFRDYNYGLNHVSSGIYHINRKGLWPDNGNCYWLDPANETTINWICSIVNELKNSGFNEVVLTDFKFPDTDQIYYTGDKEAALQAAAQKIVETCGTDSFTVSFQSSNAAFPLPEGRSRLYMENISATSVGAMAAQFTGEDPDIRLVFLAETNDTRYNAYGIFRPIAASTVLEAQKSSMGN